MTDQINPEPAQSGATYYDATSNAEWTADAVDRFLDAGSVDAVYGEPVVHEGQMIIPTAEIISALGVGFGGGGATAEPETPDAQPNSGGGGGGGGGGKIFSRPVAVVIADAAGVRVEPVVDVTKLGLAALTAMGFMIGMFFKMRSSRSLEETLKELRD